MPPVNPENLWNQSAGVGIISAEQGILAQEQGILPRKIESIAG
jgi:hypothetical protein